MTDSNGDGVRITNKDIYSELRSFEGEVRTKFDSLGKATDDRMENIENRLSRLDVKFFGLVGGLLGTLASILGAIYLILSHVGGK
jgi:hypothetical protein